MFRAIACQHILRYVVFTNKKFSNKFVKHLHSLQEVSTSGQNNLTLECGPMPNVMAALPNIAGTLCSTPQSLADAQYQSAVQ